MNKTDNHVAVSSTRIVFDNSVGVEGLEMSGIECLSIFRRFEPIAGGGFGTSKMVGMAFGIRLLFFFVECLSDGHMCKIQIVLRTNDNWKFYPSCSPNA